MSTRGIRKKTANSRKLSRQQQLRIQKIQQARRQRVQRQLEQAEIDPDTSFQGLVIKNYGQSLDVEELRQKTVYRCSFRKNLGGIVVGDEVVFAPLIQTPEQASLKFDGVITAIMPRRTLLSRPDNYGHEKLIAANIDTIFIIDAPQPVSEKHPFVRVNTGLIDRYLIIAETTGLKSVIIINKMDLFSATERSQITHVMQQYRQLDYPVLFTTIYESQLCQLKHWLENNNSIFVGQSGVGKSSLINTLIPDARAATASVSTANNKGRHTTSASQLYHLDHIGIKNANLIDSPGIRELNLWNLCERDVKNGYKEIKHLAKDCRFRDCMHQNEPDCAILEALKSNKISADRYHNYQKIMASLLHN